jgi:hypothetical protein
MRHLLLHARSRGANPTTQLLRHRSGQPLTARRYDYLWTRIRQRLPWAAAQQVSTHWLRHTTLTWVERRFGYAVARAYAGHADTRNAGSTATYIRADIHEVAAALAALAGEPHPLGPGPPQRGRLNLACDIDGAPDAVPSTPFTGASATAQSLRYAMSEMESVPASSPGTSPITGQ